MKVKNKFIIGVATFLSMGALALASPVKADPLEDLIRQTKELLEQLAANGKAYTIQRDSTNAITPDIRNRGIYYREFEQRKVKETLNSYGTSREELESDPIFKIFQKIPLPTIVEIALQVANKNALTPPRHEEKRRKFVIINWINNHAANFGIPEEDVLKRISSNEALAGVFDYLKDQIELSEDAINAFSSALKPD